MKDQKKHQSSQSEGYSKSTINTTQANGGDIKSKMSRKFDRNMLRALNKNLKLNEVNPSKINRRQDSTYIDKQLEEKREEIDRKPFLTPGPANVESYVFKTQYGRNHKMKQFSIPIKEAVSFAKQIGYDMEIDKDQYSWFYHKALTNELPRGWRREIGFQGQIYYYNKYADLATTQHPNAHFFRRSFNKLVKHKRDENNLKYEFQPGNSMMAETSPRKFKKQLKNAEQDLDPLIYYEPDQKELLIFKECSEQILESSSVKAKDYTMQSSLLQCIKYYEDLCGYSIVAPPKFILDNLKFWQLSPEKIIKLGLDLGIDMKEEIELLWIPRMMNLLPLPPFWAKKGTFSEEQDKLSYIDIHSDTKLEFHPSMLYCQKLVENYRLKIEEEKQQQKDKLKQDVQANEHGKREAKQKKLKVNSYNIMPYVNTYFDGLFRKFDLIPDQIQALAEKIRQKKKDEDHINMQPFIQTQDSSSYQDVGMDLLSKIFTFHYRQEIHYQYVTDIEIESIGFQLKLDPEKEIYLYQYIYNIVNDKREDEKWKFRIIMEGGFYWINEYTREITQIYPYLQDIRKIIQEVKIANDIIRPFVEADLQSQIIKFQQKNFDSYFELKNLANSLVHLSINKETDLEAFQQAFNSLKDTIDEESEHQVKEYMFSWPYKFNEIKEQIELDVQELRKRQQSTKETIQRTLKKINFVNKFGKAFGGGANKGGGDSMSILRGMKDRQKAIELSDVNVQKHLKAVLSQALNKELPEEEQIQIQEQLNDIFEDIEFADLDLDDLKKKIDSQKEKERKKKLKLMKKKQGMSSFDTSRGSDSQDEKDSSEGQDYDSDISELSMTSSENDDEEEEEKVSVKSIQQKQEQQEEQKDNKDSPGQKEQQKQQKGYKAINSLKKEKKSEYKPFSFKYKEYQKEQDDYKAFEYFEYKEVEEKEEGQVEGQEEGEEESQNDLDESKAIEILEFYEEENYKSNKSLVKNQERKDAENKGNKKQIEKRRKQQKEQFKRQQAMKAQFIEAIKNKKSQNELIKNNQPGSSDVQEKQKLKLIENRVQQFIKSFHKSKTGTQKENDISNDQQQEIIESESIAPENKNSQKIMNQIKIVPKNFREEFFNVEEEEIDLEIEQKVLEYFTSILGDFSLDKESLKFNYEDTSHAVTKDSVKLFAQKLGIKVMVQPEYDLFWIAKLAIMNPLPKENFEHIKEISKYELRYFKRLLWAQREQRNELMKELSPEEFQLYLEFNSAMYIYHQNDVIHYNFQTKKNEDDLEELSENQETISPTTLGAFRLISQGKQGSFGSKQVKDYISNQLMQKNQQVNKFQISVEDIDPCIIDNIDIRRSSSTQPIFTFEPLDSGKLSPAKGQDDLNIDKTRLQENLLSIPKGEQNAPVQNIRRYETLQPSSSRIQVISRGNSSRSILKSLRENSEMSTSRNEDQIKLQKRKSNYHLMRKLTKGLSFKSYGSQNKEITPVDVAIEKRNMRLKTLMMQRQNSMIQYNLLSQGKILYEDIKLSRFKFNTNSSLLKGEQKQILKLILCKKNQLRQDQANQRRTRKNIVNDGCHRFQMYDFKNVDIPVESNMPKLNIQLDQRMTQTGRKTISSGLVSARPQSREQTKFFRSRRRISQDQFSMGSYNQKNHFKIDQQSNFGSKMHKINVHKDLKGVMSERNLDYIKRFKDNTNLIKL